MFAYFHRHTRPCPVLRQTGITRHTQTAVFTLRLPAAPIVTAGNNSVVLHSIHTLIQTVRIFAEESLLDRLVEWLFVP